MVAHLPRTRGPWKSNMWPGSTSLSIFDTSSPVVDGHVLPESPLAALLWGKAADVPLLAGNVGNEASGLPHLGSLADYHAYVNETFREHAEEVLRLYPATTSAEVRTSTSELLADQVFVWPTWTSARLQVRNLKSSAWYYRFLREPPIPPDSNVIEKKYAGAFHGAGVPYAFGSLDVWQWDWTDADRALSRNMSDAWARFVRTGSPNDRQEHADSWPALKSSCDLIKIWDSESRLKTPGSRVCEITAFWDKYYGVKGHITI